MSTYIAGNSSATPSASAWIPDIFAAQAIEALYSDSVLLGRVSNFTDIAQATLGGVVNVPVAAAVTVGALTGSTDTVSFSAPADSVAAVTINQLKYVSFAVRDDAARQSAVSHAAVYAREGLRALAQQIDSDIAALMADQTTLTAGGTGTTATVSGIALAHAKLSGNKVPLDNRCVAIHPYCWWDLGKDTGYTSKDFNPTQPLFSGNSGSILGMPVEQTAVMEVNDTANPIWAYNSVFHKSAIAVAIQISPTIKTQYDIDSLSTKYVVEVLYGLAVVDANRIVRVQNKISLT